MLHEQEKKVIEQYTGFPEKNRLTYTKANETEFIVTMHYLHKFLRPNAKIADIGAGGGTYTKALAPGATGRGAAGPAGGPAADAQRTAPPGAARSARQPGSHADPGDRDGAAGADA